MSQGIALAAAPATVLGAQAAAFERVLGPLERARLQALRLPAARVGYLAAHVLARRTAAAWLGSAGWESIALAQRCPDCGGAGHGRPSVDGHPKLHLSLSHTDGMVAAVAAASPCAIDVECWHTHAFEPTVVAFAFTPAERRLLAGLDDTPAAQAPSARRLAALRLWVRKECLVKLGRLTLDGLAGCDVADAGIDALRADAPRRARLHDLELVEWLDPASATVGAVAAATPCALTLLPATRAYAFS